MRIDYNKGERVTPQLIQLRRETEKTASDQKRKVMLVFPPDWYPSEPYLSLPTLTAFLRSAG
ncbi:MAG: hypothetical protein V3R11_02595, partial [Nitrospirales bacterium]